MQGSPLPGVRGEEPRVSIVCYFVPFSAAISTKLQRGMLSALFFASQALERLKYARTFVER